MVIKLMLYFMISNLITTLTDYKNLIPIVLIFILTILLRKKNWKKCGIIYFIAFFMCICSYYLININYHMPPEKAVAWKYFSKCVLRGSIRWSLYILLNLVLWRFVIAFYYGLAKFYNVMAKKRIFVTIFAITYSIFIYRYIDILEFEGSLFESLINKIFNLIPYLWF